MPDVPPLIPTDFHIFDLASRTVRAFAVNRDGKPFRAISSLDSIAISPTGRVVLHVVAENKQVGLLHLVKIPAPGNVRRLKNYAVHVLTGSEIPCGECSCRRPGHAL